MSKKAQKSEWEIKRDKQIAENKKGMAKLTEKQLIAIKNVRKSLGVSLGSIFENQDILLSELRELDNAFHALCRHFNFDHSYWGDE
jgi:hypothetical protein